MAKKKKGLMAIGVDSGLEGAMVAIHGNQVPEIHTFKKIKAKVRKIESDDKHGVAWRRQQAGRVLKSDKPRYHGTAELKPKNMSVYDPVSMYDQLRSCQQTAGRLGYSGVFVAVEEPQTLVRKPGGKPINFMIQAVASTGRFQNALFVALHLLDVPWGYVSPITWKSAFKLTRDKEEVIAHTHQLFDVPDKYKKHDGVCEAVMIAHYLKLHCSRLLEEN